MRSFYFVSLLLLASQLNAAEYDAYRKIEIKEVVSSIITRKQDDRVYSGQINSEVGLAKFIKSYGENIKLLPIDFKKYRYIFGITDNIETRAFQFLKQEKINEYTLDYINLGVKTHSRPLSGGYKYSHLQIFVLERKEWISHINVKNIERNGLSIMYE